MAEKFTLKKWVGGKARQLTVEVLDDGSFKIDATKFPGTEKEIMAELEALAVVASGDVQALTIERHIHGAHAHMHETGEVHQH